jgi:eukaryotic-like serine/threonine-protein kinase
MPMQPGDSAASAGLDWDALELQLKKELAPSLELIRPLGRGEMAGVYLVREAALKRLVAVKVLAPAIARDATARLRFEREGQAIASIFQPNVITVFRVDRLSNEIPFLVMQYVKGKTLSDLLEAEGPIAVPQARRIIADLAAALAAAHKKGIVHRDVKPANVLIEEDTGKAILTDFGLATILTTGEEQQLHLTRTGEVIGDMAYMSPEQMMGRSLTELADIYSLGVLGYELLTQRKPFDRSAETGKATVAANLPRISQLRPDVDAPLEALLHRCLSTNPAHRPSAADLVKQLTAPTATTAETAVPPARKPDGVAVELDESAEARTGLKGFFAELKRRRVVRVTGVYVIVSVAVVGAADDFFPALNLPEWTTTLVAALALLGLPIVVGLAWAFDITPKGVVRTKAADRSN